MTLSTYLRLTTGFMLFDAIVLTVFYSIRSPFDPTSIYLAARALIDMLFIGLNFNKISFRPRDSTLIFWLTVSGFAGLAFSLSGDHIYSARRVLTDVGLPALFLLKIVLITRMLDGHDRIAVEVKQLCKWLLIASGVQIAIFLTVGRSAGAYAGVAVPATLPLAEAIVRNSLATILFLLAILLASGKRAFLLSALVALVVSNLAGKARGSSIILMTLFLPLAALSVFVLAPLFEDAFDKLDATLAIAEDFSYVLDRGPSAIFDDDVRTGFYLATAGRSEEFYSIITAMKPINYVVGLGAGFTYQYEHIDGPIAGHANSHFSPLSLTYKFGGFFSLAFYILAFAPIWRCIRSSDPQRRIAGYVLLMLLIQSLFSFNLFAEPLLPIFVALARFMNGERYFGGSVRHSSVAVAA